MKIQYAAPAKVILSGEHSVVYTKPAFVTAVDMDLTVTIESGNPTHTDLTIEKGMGYCDDIVQKYLRSHELLSEFPLFKYSIDSHIPQGRGMGSSAAFCVATVAALLHFYSGKEYPKDVINSLAYQCEKLFHGMPSGVDVSASCFGGLIFYRKEFEFLKNISALNFKIPTEFEDKLYLIDSGKPEESTKEMVSHVGKRYNEDPKGMDAILSEIEKVTKRMVVSIVKEDINMFAQSLSDNQKLLENMGIVSESTKKLLSELTEYGVGKVTGAGGLKNGSGLILFLSTKDTLASYLKEKKIPFYVFKQNYKGVNLK